MELGLRGKTALVTGGSRGIGRAVAAALVREGARVAICSRSAASLDAAARDIERTAGTAPATVAADLSRLEEVSRAVDAARDRLGTIDILVNNAGAIRGGDFLKTPDEQWLTDWNLKLHGYIRMSRTVFPIMQSHGGGRICNVIGAAARNPSPTYLPGGAANAALINFSNVLGCRDSTERIGPLSFSLHLLRRLARGRRLLSDERIPTLRASRSR